MTIPAVSVILPAHDEAGYIDVCLSALWSSDTAGLSPEVLVVANGCSDTTAETARSHAERARAAGWELQVIETPRAGKPHALTLGDHAARGAVRVYLDADVVVGPALVRALAHALDTAAPGHASGHPSLAPAASPLSRAYGRIWSCLPFFRSGTAGFGVFALNRAGRARWGDWPEVISDDTFARLNFAPHERIAVPETYSWPLVEGFRRLVRVRRRQNRGVAEIAQRYPQLVGNAADPPPGAARVMRLALRDPVGMAVYLAVSLAVKLPAPGGAGWARGR